MELKDAKSHGQPHAGPAGFGGLAEGEYLLPGFRGKFIAGLKRLYRRRQLRCAGSCAALAEEKPFRELLRHKDFPR